jgi:hypothetical protein
MSLAIRRASFDKRKSIQMMMEVYLRGATERKRRP